MAFSATDVALEGFKITRARPVSALVWAGVQLVLVVLQRVSLVWLAGPELRNIAIPNLFSAIPTQELMRLTTLMSEFLAVNVVLWVIAYGVLYPAVDRAVMRPSEGGPGWLKLGPDELRQAAVLFCFTLVLWAVYLAVGVVASMVVSLIAAGLGLGQAGTVLGLAIAFLAAIAAVVWIGVRLSLAPPATFDRRRFVLFDTWSLTRGRFWPLLGAYIVAWLLWLLVTILVVFIGAAIASLLPGATDAVPATFREMLTPSFVVEVVFSALAGGLGTPLILAPAAYAYRELAGTSAEPAATFS